MAEDDSNKEINYEMHLKSTTGEISVYIIQPELAESYDNNCLKLRLQPEAKKIKTENDLEEKKEEKKDEKKEEKKQEAKPKKRVGRYFFIIYQFLYLYRVKYPIDRRLKQTKLQ